MLARRCGKPNIHTMTRAELDQAEESFLARVQLYFANLETVSA